MSRRTSGVDPRLRAGLSALRKTMTRLALLMLPLTLFPSSARGQDEERVAPQLEQFWTREVEAVQPLQVHKTRALELAVMVGVIPNDPYLFYIPLGLRAAFHLTERWAIEISFEGNLSVDTGLRRFLEENDAALRAQIRDRQQLRVGAGASLAPLYGKVAIGRRVIHFDGYLAAGAGVVRTAAEESIGLSAAIRPDFYLGTGLRVFVHGRWLLRLEGRQYLYLRPTDSSGRGGGVGFPLELAVLGGLLLGGHR
jgi:outer membrane beta-barrel protein